MSEQLEMPKRMYLLRYKRHITWTHSVDMMRLLEGSGRGREQKQRNMQKNRNYFVRTLKFREWPPLSILDNDIKIF